MDETIGVDGDTIALHAFSWILADDARASRFVALTGVEPGEIASQLGSSNFTRAIFSFLMGHESDLIACADALGHKPDALARIGARFNPDYE